MLWINAETLFRVAMHQSSCCPAVRVGLRRCQIWDSLPRRLRLEKCGAWRHGLDCFEWRSCMAQIFRRKARMGQRGHRLTTSWLCPSIGTAILKILSQKKGKWKPCKAASSLPFTVLGQSCHTMGERFLHQRFDLLPDVCLATRALGHWVIAFNDYSDHNARQCYCWNS